MQLSHHPALFTIPPAGHCVGRVYEGAREDMGGGRGSQGDGVGWMFNDNYAVGGTDRYHWQLPGYPHQPHILQTILKT